MLPLLEAALRSATLMESAAQLAQITVSEWDLDTHELLRADALFRLLGFEPGEIGPRLQRPIDSVPPADAESVHASSRPQDAEMACRRSSFASFDAMARAGDCRPCPSHRRAACIVASAGWSAS